MAGLLSHKLPISLLVSNGGILIGLLFGAFQFYQQFESNTQAIERLTEQMGQVEERITASNVEGISDQFRYLDDRLNQEVSDLGFQVDDVLSGLGNRLDEVRRDSEARLEAVKSEAGYVTERLAVLEQRAQTQDQNISEQNWSGEDIQRQVSQLTANLQGLQSSVSDVEEVQREVGYIKERLSALDVLVNQPSEVVDTSWLENEVMEISRRLTDSENLISEMNSRTSIQIDDLYAALAATDDRLAALAVTDSRVAALDERLSLLERVGNHAKLLDKARKK
jgi:chromosome segregation ATPase